MKRILCLTMIILMAAALVCGCSGSSGQHGVKPSPTPRTSTPSPVQTANPKSYEYSITVKDGTVEGSTFNWQFFLAKVMANKPGELLIVNDANGERTEYLLSFRGGAFTVSGPDGEKSYGHIVTETAELETGSADIAILTDDASLTAESFFGGAVPQDIAVGYSNESGMVIFVDRK
ncbi:MAG: hypothetical protein J5586_08720 [Clostridia bacterium]|nr:hypothetical protein [Clostridia bacterium]